MAPNYYQILGVSPDADQASIKRAYRNLARRFHPDLNQGSQEAAQRFKEISEAYATLSDGARRRAYDQNGNTQHRPDNYNWENWFGGGSGFGTESKSQNNSRENEPDFTQKGYARSDGDGQNGGFGGFPGTSSPGTSSRSGDQQKSSFANFFQNVFGGEDGTDDHRSGRPNSNRNKRTYTTHVGIPSSFQASPDNGLPVEISLDEAFRGTTRTIQQGHQRFEVVIPKGVETGSKVRISRPESRDDLLLVINVRPHAHLERDGQDLFVEMRIDLYMALLGGEVRVPTLEGELLLMVPPNTQNGRVFRLKGQGMPLLKNPEQSGDLYVEVQVDLPVPLSEEEHARFVELRRLRWNDELFSE